MFTNYQNNGKELLSLRKLKLTIMLTIDLMENDLNNVLHKSSNKMEVAVSPKKILVLKIVTSWKEKIYSLYQIYDTRFIKTIDLS